MTEPLLPEPQMERHRPLGWVEPSVNFLKESTRADAVAARANVNAWYGEFPYWDGEFAKRLRGEDDGVFYSALDELFVHHLLTRDANRDVRYEEDGTGPDFRTYRDDQPEAAIEVVSLYQRADWTDEERQFGRIADELNKRLCVTRYMLRLEVVKHARTPSAKKIADWVQQRIDELPDPTEVASAYDAHRGLGSLPRASYEEPGVRLEFTFVPVKPDAPSLDDPDARIVGMGPMIGGAVNSASRLRDRLRSKRISRYGIEDLPYAVVVGVHDTFCDRYTVETALYGTEAVEINSGIVRRSNDGFFGADAQKPEGRHRGIVSVAVLQFTAWDADNASLWLLDNPYALQRLPDDVLPATHRLGALSRDASGSTFGWQPEEPPDGWLSA